MSTPDAVRLAAVISPLRRTLLAATRTAEHLPEIPDAQIEIIRALPRGVERSPGELAERLGLRRSTVSNLLTAMVESGLVARNPAPDDGRRVEVRATQKALRLFERFDAASAALIAAAISDLSPEDGDALVAALPVLERLRDRLDEQRRADTTPTPGRSAPASDPAVDNREEA